MKAVKAGLLAAACAVTISAQQDTDLQAWMEYSDKAMVVLKKLEVKTGPEAVSAAERLGGIYENMVGFWRQKNSADAVRWSEEGKAAAIQLANAAHAGEAEKAAAALKSLSATCKPCHDKHRERLPGGKYRMK